MAWTDYLSHVYNPAGEELHMLSMSCMSSACDNHDTCQITSGQFEL